MSELKLTRPLVRRVETLGPGTAHDFTEALFIAFGTSMPGISRPLLVIARFNIETCVRIPRY
jgi:hypothetical protein